MGVKIAHASIDENGKIAGGVIGDQTRKELCIRDWYNKPWNVVLKCTDRKLAKKACEIAVKIAGNPNYGYNQEKRVSGYNSIFTNNFDIDKGKGDFDCSTYVSSVYRLAGLNTLAVSNTTSSLRRALLATGLFVEYTDSSHTASSTFAGEGDIYLSEGHHVVIVIGADKVKPNNPYATPTTDVQFGESGTSIRWVQWELTQAGYKLKIDGDFGSQTDKWVRDYQKKNGLEVDGIVGPKTREHMITH
jgi:hypothetical protein